MRVLPPRVPSAEEDLARAVMQSLSDEQRKTAIIDTTAPSDIVSGPGRKAMLLEPAGLPACRRPPNRVDC